MTELTSEAIAEMTREFERSGGRVRRIRRGASANRPATLPRDLRDEYLERGRHKKYAGMRYVLTLKQVLAVERMIERRAGLDAIAARIGMAGKSLEKIVARLEASGVAFPDYLRRNTTVLVADRRKKPKQESVDGPEKKAPTRPGKEIRPLTSMELQAFEMVRCGYNNNVAAKSYGIQPPTLRQLIITRFGDVHGLQKIQNFAALQRALEVASNRSEETDDHGPHCLNCGASMPEGWRGGRCDPCAGRAPLRRDAE